MQQGALQDRPLLRGGGTPDLLRGEEEAFVLRFGRAPAGDAEVLKGRSTGEAFVLLPGSSSSAVEGGAESSGWFFSSGASG